MNISRRKMFCLMGGARPARAAAVIGLSAEDSTARIEIGDAILRFRKRNAFAFDSVVVE